MKVLLTADPCLCLTCCCVAVVWLLCSYYSLEDISHESINRYLSSLVERSLRDLECSYCIEIQEVCSAAPSVPLAV